MKFWKLVKYLFFGISWGCLFFVLTCLIGNMVGGEDYLLAVVGDFNRQALGAMAVGIGYGTTAMVYDSEKLPFGLQVFIHFAVGTGIYFPVAFSLGWIPTGSPVNIILMVLLSAAVFFIIWSGFYLYYRGEARRMNEKLRELEQKKGPGQ